MLEFGLFPYVVIIYQAQQRECESSGVCGCLSSLSPVAYQDCLPEKTSSYPYCLISLLNVLILFAHESLS